MPSPVAPVAIPPPPGFAAPPEAAPAAPDPRRDPYAAQQAALAANLAAFYNAGALPGSGDAVKGDPIQKPKPWGLIGGLAGIGVLMFGVGYSVGTISVSRNDYNTTTDQAVKVRDEVEKIKKEVIKVAEQVKQIRLSDKDPPNFQVIEKLGEIDLKEPDITRNLFHTNYASFEPPTVQQLFNYYNDVIVLSRQVAEHSVKTMKDKDSIDKYTKGNATKQDKAIGVILDFSQALPTSQLVELGQLVCPKADQTDCPPAEAKMKFRTSIGGEFATRVLKGAPKDAVFPMAPTELQKQVLSGDPGLLAFRDYVRRHAAIVETLRRIGETEKQLTEGLKKRANQPKLFAL